MAEDILIDYANKNMKLYGIYEMVLLSFILQKSL